MSSQKERDVLEQQRKLAMMMGKKVKKPPPPPTAPSNSSAKRKPASSLTVGGLTLGSKRPKVQEQKPPPPPPKPSTSSAAPAQKRPTMRNRANIIKGATQGSNASAAAILAQARAKATGGQVSSVSGKSEVSGSGSALASNGIPKLQRKKTSAEDGRKARLASLVRSAAVAPAKDQGSALSSAAFSTNTSPDDFWKNLREWDFIADLSKQRQPADEDDADKKEAVPKHKPIPDTFINHRHYVATWAPLCLAETRAQLLSDVMTEYGQGNNSRRNPPLLLVKVETTWKGGPSRRDQSVHTDLNSMDSWHVRISVKHRGDGGYLQFYTHDICFLVAVSHMNLVERLLSGGSITKTEEMSYRKFGLIGHTEVSRKEVNGLILKVSKKRWAQAGKPEMYLLKLGGNVTALREFTALCGVETTPLKTFLLGHHLEDPNKRAKSKEFATKGTDELLKKMGGVEALGKGFTQYAQHKFNPSQLKAISASAQGYGDGGFTLIKGPPGTGSKSIYVMF